MNNNTVQRLIRSKAARSLHTTLKVLAVITPIFISFTAAMGIWYAIEKYGWMLLSAIVSACVVVVAFIFMYGAYDYFNNCHIVWLPFSKRYKISADQHEEIVKTQIIVPSVKDLLEVQSVQIASTMRGTYDII